MKALRVNGWGPEGGVILEDVPVPEPGSGDIRVRVRAAGISFPDLLVTRGAYQVKPPVPFTAGSEFSGIVDAIGPSTVTDLKVGDAVCGVRRGAWAEYTCVPADWAHRVPSTADVPESTVVVLPYSTALYGLRERGSLAAGETLLVLGAGGAVGLAAVQLGKRAGARVIAGASSESKRDRARAAGADETVDTSGDWKAEIKRLAGPKGVDVCFDPVGGEATEIGFRSLGWGGRHLMVGFASGTIPALKGNLALVKGAALVGVDVRQYCAKDPLAGSALERECLAMYSAGAIRPVVQSLYPAERFAEAEQLAGSRDSWGRVLLTF